MNERDAFKTDNIGLEMENKELEAKLAALEKEMGTVKQDIAIVHRVNAIKLLRITIKFLPGTMNCRMHRKI